MVIEKTEAIGNELLKKTTEYVSQLQYVLEAEYFLKDEEGCKLRPKGMMIICNYYRKKHGLNNIFSAANYTEAANLIEAFKHNNHRFGIAYVNVTNQSISGSIHIGSIVVDGTQAFIIDSLGSGVGSGAEYFRQFLIEKNLFDKRDIYISEVLIQKDRTSCGTLSFLFLKESLRMGSTLKDFMLANVTRGNKVTNLPSNLLKYIQSMQSIEEFNKQNDEEYAYYPEMPIRNKKKRNLKQTETLLQYVNRHREKSSKENTKQKCIAATERAKKHINLIINPSIRNQLADFEEEMATIIHNGNYSKRISDNFDMNNDNASAIFLCTPENKPRCSTDMSPAKKQKKLGLDYDTDGSESMSFMQWLSSPSSNHNTPSRSGVNSVNSTPTNNRESSSNRGSSSNRAQSKVVQNLHENFFMQI